VSERRVAVNGVELAVEEHGAGARALVLVHGFSGFRQDFAPVIDALLPHAQRIVALDLRGHGASTHTGDAATYTLDVLADDVRGALAALGIARCDLLGHSMGGMLAQRVALADPQRVALLLLMSTSAEALEWINEDHIRLAAYVGSEQGMTKLAEVLRARAADDPTRGEADRRLERAWGAERFWGWRDARVIAMDPVAYQALGLALKRAPDFRAHLSALRCPALVAVGALDAEFVEASPRLAAAIRGARHVVIPNAGHQPQLEAPAAFVDALREHLARVRAA
jgi:2-succinyl-6-hydroxy-2,4-cyclohexadiene-1-carboxylate synthase